MTERIKFSTASELLREDTFEAERLMELHTLHDYKERQISRLRQEERELMQIIADGKEIITAYGASFGPNSESFNDVIPQIIMKETDIEITKSNSARGPHEKPEHSKISLSGSASNLIDELQQALSNQPLKDGPGMSIAQRQSHTFAQSRQNYFPIPQISNILDELEEMTDYSLFFSQFPLSLILVTGFYENSFPIDTILSSIENWTVKKRQNFFTELFKDMRKCAKFMNLIFEIANLLTIYSLTNLCESILPHYFNAKRVCFLFHDSQNEELVFIKEKIKIRFPVKQGIFMRSLLSQSPVESSIEDPEVSQSDKVIIQQNKQIFIIPVLSIRSQFHVEGLLVIFDKLGGVKSADYLCSSIIARCIAQIVPSLKTLEENALRRSAFQSSVDTYVSLCTSSDLASLVTNISSSFCDYFNCEAVRIFKVFHRTQTYREVTRYETLENAFPFTSGIIGSCIANCSSINLSKPQFYENYNTEVDCYDANSFSSSLLVGTISDERRVCKWAIALYNKKERSSFTPLDEESLSTICVHLFPLLHNSWSDKKLKQTINHSKKQLAQAEALTDTIASLRSPTDIESMLIRMNKFFKANTQYSQVTLYSLNAFRRELVSHNMNPMDVIPLDSDDPVAECARTGKLIERKNQINDTHMIFLAVLNSASSVIGVFKIGGASDSELLKNLNNVSSTSLESRGSQSSLTMLNTFRSSSRLLSFLNLETCRGDLNDEEKIAQDNETVLKMMKMWQKVAGSVLEGAQKHLLYSKRKQLIDHMSIALYDNLFESSFKVWQEVQCLVDSFDNLDYSAVNIESPVITDLVFANTSELSEKTVQLIRTLQSLNAIDQSIFTPQTTEKTKNENITSFIEDDGKQCPFLTTSAIDLLSMEEGLLIQNIVQSFNELAILQFLEISENDAMEFIMELRGLHPPNTFRNWRLAVDHFQFAAFLMLNTSFGKAMSDAEMIGVLLFLLALYSDPPDSMNDVTPLKRARFTLETSGMFSTISSFFTACAWCKIHIFKSIPPDDMVSIWNLLDELEMTGNPDAFLNATPALLLCCVARNSHMMRETGVTIKWYNLKLKEDTAEELLDDLDEIKEFQLQFENDAVMEPLMEEAAKIDPNITSLMQRFKSNCNSILGK
ncbi:hypothetical protein TRFO_12140 [Tritrichomonas foetus]|uniref:Uncharacterized protein n=1 Tax=Tritrichomonas foetus TaxID=1144522 RepID=A0A1J4J6Z2_9EUKA|nr:hypothetical protein TRFO_12140 [Tritrichomonas foetus]|eukprot:OHS92956.1 hypothetical protein TRFO_12140 [Tritrichomonas foetus]